MKDGTTAFTLTTPGTGPFKLQSWVPGTSYVLAANEHWFGEHTPYLDTVEVNLGISAVTARLDGLLAGQFDAVERLDPTTASSVTSNPQTKLLVGDPGAYTPMIMNLTAPPF